VLQMSEVMLRYNPGLYARRTGSDGTNSVPAVTVDPAFVQPTKYSERPVRGAHDEVRIGAGAGEVRGTAQRAYEWKASPTVLP